MPEDERKKKQKQLDDIRLLYDFTDQSIQALWRVGEMDFYREQLRPFRLRMVQRMRMLERELAED